jgi:hypothetical protein
MDNKPSVVAFTRMSVLAAIAKIEAEPAGRRGWWQYRASEIGATCFVTTKELAELGSLLANPETSRDAYSIWCAASPTRERLPDRGGDRG